jgi:hypothetical protein
VDAPTPPSASWILSVDANVLTDTVAEAVAEVQKPGAEIVDSLTRCAVYLTRREWLLADSESSRTLHFRLIAARREMP